MTVDWISRAASLRHAVYNFVGGKRLPVDGEPLEKYSPRNGEILYRLGSGNLADLEKAVAGASQAVDDGRWSALSPESRREILLRFAGLLDQHREELALLECIDVGKPIRDAMTIDTTAAANVLRWNAEAIDKLYGRMYAVDKTSMSYQLYRPVGLVAGIVGWNFPLLLALMKIAPALAMGNCLILKPSEHSPSSAGRVAELAIEAGVPEHVLNVVQGGAAVGAALASHPEVALVTFTGSTQTGRRLLAASGASNIKRLILECGGKAPNIVFDDCPSLDHVAEAVVSMAFRNQGQVCTASSRLLVDQGIARDLIALVIEKTKHFELGDPLDPDTTFGALISQSHKELVLSYINKGKMDGADKIYQSESRAPFENGFYVAPVIFANVQSHHTIAQEEIFGPVLSILTFKDEEEAIRIANGTAFGLSAVLWTGNMGRAHRVMQRIQAGWIVINTTGTPTGGPGGSSMSSGGLKQSGFGLEGGLEGLEGYVTKTAVQVFM